MDRWNQEAALLTPYSYLPSFPQGGSDRSVDQGGAHAPHIVLGIGESFSAASLSAVCAAGTKPQAPVRRRSSRTSSLRFLQRSKLSSIPTAHTAIPHNRRTWPWKQRRQANKRRRAVLYMSPLDQQSLPRHVAEITLLPLTVCDCSQSLYKQQLSISAHVDLMLCIP